MFRLYCTCVELSLYVAVFLALIELSRAFHVWWRTRLVRRLYAEHYVDHPQVERDGSHSTYTRYDRTMYFGRSPYARILPAIVSREGVVLLVVALVFADAFISLCALGSAQRLKYGFLLSFREWFDQRTEAYQVYQRYIRLSVSLFFLVSVCTSPSVRHGKRSIFEMWIFVSFEEQLDQKMDHQRYIHLRVSSVFILSISCALRIF